MSNTPSDDDRPRIHGISFDLYDWKHDGNEYAVALTINEADLSDVIKRACERHDGRTELAGGGIVITAKKIATKQADSLFASTAAEASTPVTEEPDPRTPSPEQT